MSRGSEVHSSEWCLELLSDGAATDALLGKRSRAASPPECPEFSDVALPDGRSGSEKLVLK